MDQYDSAAKTKMSGKVPSKGQFTKTHTSTVSTWIDTTRVSERICFCFFLIWVN